MQHAFAPGELHVTLRFVPAISVLQVHLHAARGLRAADWNGLSDPYVKLRLTVDDDSAKPQKARTDVFHKTVDPVFDEIFDLRLRQQHVASAQLQLSVYDWDQFSSHDFLGLVRLRLAVDARGDPTFTFTDWLPLHSKNYQQTDTVCLTSERPAAATADTGHTAAKSLARSHSEQVLSAASARARKSAAVQSIINFMIGPDLQMNLMLWFGKSSQYDQHMKDEYMHLVEQASAQQLSDWEDEPQSCLALVLLLDQFRRNIFRNQAAMYGCDEYCVSVVERALDRQLHLQLTPAQRVFLPCLVFTHSEKLSVQRRCMEEWANVRKLLSPDDPMMVFSDIFERHIKVVEQFGRFPHRNPILGRETTPEEREFLDDPRYRFDLPVRKDEQGNIYFAKTSAPADDDSSDAATPEISTPMDLIVPVDHFTVLSDWVDRMNVNMVAAAQKKQTLTSGFRKLLKTFGFESSDPVNAARQAALQEFYFKERKAVRVAVRDVSVHDVAAFLRDPDARILLVDIRTPEEREVARIVPSLSITEFHAEPPERYNGYMVVMCCLAGVRSMHYVVSENSKQTALPYELANLRCGLLQWIHADYPVFNPAGEPTTRVHAFKPFLKALVPERYTAVQ